MGRAGTDAATGMHDGFSPHPKLGLMLGAANFSAFIRESANWGLTFSRKALTAMVKWNYRGLQKGVQVVGVDGFQYGEPRTTLDMNVDYQFQRNMSFYINAQNLLNIPKVLLRHGAATPGYARSYQVTTYGVQLTMGVKGTF